MVGEWYIDEIFGYITFYLLIGLLITEWQYRTFNLDNYYKRMIILWPIIPIILAIIHIVVWIIKVLE